MLMLNTVNRQYRYHPGLGESVINWSGAAARLARAD
jgi:hypothetical protein